MTAETSYGEKRKYSGMTWMKKHFVTILLWIIGLIGAGLLGYPTFSNWWNSMRQSELIGSYTDMASSLDTGELDEILRAAEDYNRSIVGWGLLPDMTEEEAAEYMALLSIDDSGLMAVIDIPKIHVHLPVYHGTSDDVLQAGVGHIEGSSLPVGGETTHCVLSGHRGLTSAKLFSDLDEIREGDIWTITVLNRTITYETDQILVVEPEDLSALRIEEGEDYCTLVTCTPYGVNTHRLLIRGRRIENIQGDAEVFAEASRIEPMIIIPIIGIPILFILLTAMLIYTDRENRARRAWRRARVEYGAEEEDGSRTNKGG